MSLSTGTCPDSWKSCPSIYPNLVTRRTLGTIGLSPSFPLWVNCLRNTSEISCVNTLTFLHDQQWGFQACKSTTNAILSATNEWFIHLENRAEVQAVFFDFQKSFNSVPHCLLIDKLHQLEIQQVGLLCCCFYKHASPATLRTLYSPHPSTFGIHSPCGIHISARILSQFSSLY